MGYQFKLEALRNYRQYQEETRQKELAEADQIRQQIAGELKLLLIKQHETEQDLKTHQKENAAAPMMTLYASYLKKITAEIALQRQKVATAEATCKKKRDDLLLAMQKRKALERIKEKDFEKYLATLEHKEAKFINEMAINRFALNQK
jgi:flagellar FliJ protein